MLISQGYGFVSTSSTQRTGDRRWDAQGTRIVPDIQQAVARARTVQLPPSVAPVATEVTNETAAQLAVHQFTAEYITQVTTFFNRFVPPAGSR